MAASGLARVVTTAFWKKRSQPRASPPLEPSPMGE